MIVVPVYVTHELRVDGNNLGHDLVEQIFDALTITNQEHVKAKKAKRYKWWEIPEFHEPFALDGDTVVLPRGFALQLKQILRANGIRVDWIDRTKWRRGELIGPEQFSYRDHQPAAVTAIKKHRQGIYKAPTGSGKTVTFCGLIWNLSPQRTLILVDKINLVNQWVRHIEDHLHPDFKIARIGEGLWEDGRITVATIQSIWSQRVRLEEQGFFSKWDLVALDEAHHVTADTFRRIMHNFTARYRIGLSATPDKTGEFELAKAVLGPVFHEDTHAQLRDSGILIKPTVKVTYSDFQFAFYGDHKADKQGECDKPGCTNERPYHKHRNNYMDLKAALVRDESRNGLIVEICKREEDHPILVITDQTTHINAIIDAMVQDGWLDMGEVYVLTSKQKGYERDAIIANVQKRKKGIILSTIASEALDLPVLDRIVLAFPTRNAKKVEQQVGRGTRATNGKTDCIVYDIADNVGPLLAQLQSRIRGCYQPLELELELINEPKRKGALCYLPSSILS